MKVWLVTVGEPVPFGADSRDRVLRTGYLAKVLAAQGHQVTWWTSAFNHFKKTHLYPVSTTVTPSENLRVRLLKTRGYRRNISISRLLDHWQMGRRFSREIEAEARPDVILASLPTIELASATVRYGLRRQVPVVLDMRDMWPDIFLDHAPRPLRLALRLALAPLFRNARTACAGATAITGITDEFLAWGLRRGRRSRSRRDRVFPLAYVTEKPDPAALQKADAFWDGLNVSRDSRLTACFVGTMNAQYDLDGVLRAAAVLRATNAVRFVLCGIGDRLERYRQAAAGLPNVLFPGWVDYPQIYSLLRRVEIGLDPIPDRYDYLATVNNKAIEYFSAGLPVISCPHHGVLASLLTAHDCGMSYPHGDGDTLARMLLDVAGRPDRLAQMGANSMRLFELSFRADRIYGEFAAYLERIAGGAAA